MRVMMRNLRNRLVRIAIALYCLAPEIVDEANLSSFNMSIVEYLARYSKVMLRSNVPEEIDMLPNERRRGLKHTNELYTLTHSQMFSILL